ncbi:zinc-binding dehydrogenase [Streptomyces sp. NPDC052415]|uniref:zinc-binding dehydrogenase n=1 Tax=Streptomyces sp. NPDC052415 TaxID=3365690 RepID=UPI0037CF2E42
MPWARTALTPLPEAVTAAAAAAASDSLTDAYSAVWTGLRDRPGQPVLVVGGLTHGLYACAFAAALGSSQVVYADSDARRRRTAESYGAHTVDSAAELDAGAFPVTVDASADPRGLAAGLRATAPGGHCHSVGIYFEPVKLPLMSMYMDAVTLTTGRPDITAHLPAVLSLLASGQVDPLPVYSDTLAYDDLPEALLDLPAKPLASGRRTELPAMLERLGATHVVHREETGFRYYSRFFRADDRGLPVSRYWPLTHHDSVSVITAPGDGDHWSVTLVTSGRDQALRRLSDPGVWDAVLALYPEAAHWAEGVPDGDVRVMGGTGTTHRRWVSDGEPLVTGLVAVGDAHMTLNPQFGMGMTAGLGQVQVLRDVVRRAGLGDPADLVLALDSELEERYWPTWNDGDTWDRHRLAEVDAEIRGESYSTDDPAWALRTALDTAATLDADVVRGFGRVASQLASAEEALIKPGLVQRIVELATGRPRYAPGAPDRAVLLETVGRLA